MPAKDPSNIPVEMEKVYQELRQWRSTRRGRSPIPARLWMAAAGVARKYGLNRTSQVLHLEFNKLKGFVESIGPAKRITHRPPQFVELVAAPPADVPEYVIELESRRGKMRIQWKGITPPDLAGLSRILWGPE
jgi:hypothetical protein